MRPGQREDWTTRPADPGRPINLELPPPLHSHEDDDDDDFPASWEDEYPDPYEPGGPLDD